MSESPSFAVVGTSPGAVRPFATSGFEVDFAAAAEVPLFFGPDRSCCARRSAASPARPGCFAGPFERAKSPRNAFLPDPPLPPVAPFDEPDPVDSQAWSVFHRCDGQNLRWHESHSIGTIILVLQPRAEHSLGDLFGAGPRPLLEMEDNELASSGRRTGHAVERWRSMAMFGSDVSGNETG